MVDGHRDEVAGREGLEERGDGVSVVGIGCVSIGQKGCASLVGWSVGFVLLKQNDDSGRGENKRSCQRMYERR